MNDSLSTLRGTDLDLLVSFDAIFHAGGVTAAARELGVSQPAMSHSLRRLRAHFGDPLFVRAGTGLTPTPFAESMAGPLRAVLLDLRRVLEGPEAFDPATSQRTFRLVTPDLFDALLLPKVVERVVGSAPGVGLQVLPGTPVDVEEALRLGTVDLAIVPVLEGSAPPGASGLVRRTLFRDRFSCFLREGHPALESGELGLEGFLSARHLLISPEGRGPGVVDLALTRLDRTREVAVRLPSFTSSLRFVSSTDLVLTAPASLKELIGEQAVVMHPSPVELPGHGVAMVWHERFSQESGLQWFREQLVAASRGAGLSR